MHKTKQNPKYFFWPHYKNKVSSSELVFHLISDDFKTQILFFRFAGDCTIKDEEAQILDLIEKETMLINLTWQI